MEKVEQKSKNWFVGVFSDLVGLFDTKGRAAATVAMLITIVYLYKDNRDLQAERLRTVEDGRDREIRIYQSILKSPEFKNMQKTSDSSKAKVDSAVNLITPVIEKVSKTIDKINKNR